MRSEVVIGIITDNTNVLIVKRKEGEGKLRWQFPGGTVEAHETERQTLIREIFEETGCEVITDSFLGQRVHPYTNKVMSYWACKYVKGKIRISDNDLEDAKWVDKKKLKEYFTTSMYEPIADYLQI